MPISIKSEIKLPTGEPDAGNLPVRFGGRGSGQSRFPYLYEEKTRNSFFETSPFATPTKLATTAYGVEGDRTQTQGSLRRQPWANLQNGVAVPEPCRSPRQSPGIKYGSPRRRPRRWLRARLR